MRRFLRFFLFFVLSSGFGMFKEFLKLVPTFSLLWGLTPGAIFTGFFLVLPRRLLFSPSLPPPKKKKKMVPTLDCLRNLSSVLTFLAEDVSFLRIFWKMNALLSTDSLFV